MAGLTNGPERPQLSSKFNLVPEVDSPYSAISRERPIRFNPNSTSQKSRGPSQTTYSPFRRRARAHTHSHNGAAVFDRSYYLAETRESDYPAL